MSTAQYESELPGELRHPERLLYQILGFGHFVSVVGPIVAGYEEHRHARDEAPGFCGKRGAVHFRHQQIDHQ